MIIVLVGKVCSIGRYISRSYRSYSIAIKNNGNIVNHEMMTTISGTATSATTTTTTTSVTGTSLKLTTTTTARRTTAKMTVTVTTSSRATPVTTTTTTTTVATTLAQTSSTMTTSAMQNQKIWLTPVIVWKRTKEWKIITIAMEEHLSIKKTRTRRRNGKTSASKKMKWRQF